MNLQKASYFLKVLFITFVIFLSSTKINAQALDEVVIDEHYILTPLDKVLEEFKTNYKLKIRYDSLAVSKYKYSDHGKLWAVSPQAAFKAICMEFPRLSFSIDSNEVIHLREKPKADLTDNTTNEKYYGAAKKSNIKVSGVIKDKQTGESLPYATVYENGTTKGTTTNVDGYYTLFNVTSDTSSLMVTYIGYKKTKVYLNPSMDLSNLIIEVEVSSTNIDEVVISADREDLMENTDKVSVVKMSPKKMAKLPSIGEKDIFRSFQLLPGVSGSNESSSGLFVRGGTPDQNLILYDGFTVYHVDHLFGMFSAFNSNAVKDVQLHKGGFESQFGGRISSVMEIVGKDGNEKDFNLGGGIGLLSANLFAEIPIKDKVTILLAGRRSWKSPIYNKIFESFNEAAEEPTAAASGGGGKGGGNRSQEQTQPSSYFYDLNAKITYKPTSKDIISYSFFNGQDNLDNSREINRTRGGSTISGGVSDLSKWGSLGMSTTWSRKWSDIFYTNVLASSSKYFSLRDLSNSRSITNSAGETTEIKRGSLEDNLLKDYTLKLDNEFKIGKNHQVEFGLQATQYNIDYDYSLNDTISIQERHDNGNLVSVYLQDNWKLWKNKITLSPGIRTSQYSVTEKTYNEPRASLQYKLTKNLTFKSAWGHYYQFANRIVRNDISSGSRDFWVLANGEDVPISFAEHFILGASYETKNYIYSIEAYQKDLKGLSEYSLQFAPSFSNVDFNEFYYEGTGVAKGIEFLVQKKFGKYNGWLGYTLGEVLYDFPIYGDYEFYANHDVTHEFKIVNTYKHKKWTFAATWIYATGKPYTEPLGGYTTTLLDGSTQDFLNIGAKNAARYPDYHRLDVSATLDFKTGETGKGSIGFSIFNLYNRKNIWYKEFEVEEGELVETDVVLLGLVPSISLSLKLR